MKEIVAKEIAKRIKNGQIIGVGTGSTVDLAIIEIAKRVKNEKLDLAVVPTSYETAWACRNQGLKVLSADYPANIEWGFDGADEVDPSLCLIKGRGAALLREKILAAKCKNFTIIIDQSKLVKKLGDKFPVPVEVVPEAISLAEAGLMQLGAESMTLRSAEPAKHGPVITEKGNLILDVKFQNNIQVNRLEHPIKSIIGVIDCGIFSTFRPEVLVAKTDGVYRLSLDQQNKLLESKI